MLRPMEVSDEDRQEGYVRHGHDYVLGRHCIDCHESGLLSESDLGFALSSLVRQFGMSQVRDTLRRGYVPYLKSDREVEYRALDFVKNLEAQGMRSFMLRDLARRYDERKFLPMGRDIDQFLFEYDLHADSDTRAGAIPVVFTYLAQEMDDVEFHKVTTGRKYPGASKWGSLAGQVRRVSGE